MDEFYPLSCIHSPRSSSLFPIQPLLSAQWKSLITGGESNPWHWMKDEGLPPPFSFSQSLSLSSFFHGCWLCLAGFLHLSLSLPHFPAPSIKQSFSCFYSPISFFSPVLFYEQVKVSWKKSPQRRIKGDFREEEVDPIFALDDDIQSCSQERLAQLNVELS